MKTITKTTERKMTNLDLLKLENKVAQDKIDAIKKSLAAESDNHITKVPVVVQVDE